MEWHLREIKGVPHEGITENQNSVFHVCAVNIHGMSCSKNSYVHCKS